MDTVYIGHMTIHVQQPELFFLLFQKRNFDGIWIYVYIYTIYIYTYIYIYLNGSSIGSLFLFDFASWIEPGNIGGRWMMGRLFPLFSGLCDISVWHFFSSHIRPQHSHLYITLVLISRYRFGSGSGLTSRFKVLVSWFNLYIVVLLFLHFIGWVNDPSWS